MLEVTNDIKKELRASMNGILSARMREAGMPFKLIFGVELPRLQDIAREFPQDADLAQHLWSENIRETRLLAIMLMPPDAFTQEKANLWAESMLTAEEAQIMAMLLLPKTKVGRAVSIMWLEAGKPLPSTCACLCLRHLLTQGTEFSGQERQAIEEHLVEILPTANLHLRKAILALEDILKK